MSKVPSLSYNQIVRALQRDGWTLVRQRGSHLRLQKHFGDELLKITLPAHRPVKRSTLAHLIETGTNRCGPILGIGLTQVDPA
ncbi:MAG TPA: type II toxin-antitoxin system HicA family toxin [Terriglobia bacterium]|nr:type II toxin-antitoxin system HicA family toxin [Terriglobia bacterium]